MADEDTNTSRVADAARKLTDDTEAALRKEIASLKRQLTRMTNQMAGRAEEVGEEASGWYDAAADRAARTTEALKTQAQTVSDTVRENPGTHSGALLLGGMLGLAIGMMLGQQESRSARWWER
ncbi:hypothetical protein [Mesorhizobium sp. 8]|uniref:hypothetical protein n=1 Tax=Mesorhizobium sp. 8 TaxID=2584466 RepID=UPI001121493D|nr:hypothetical protein [Mesorhizobium sp. 8]QDB99774.1 hypothetical protein FGU64_04765 [Mesorhizobium sp. 8]